MDSVTSTGSETALAPSRPSKVFAREATGLVREVSTLDASIAGASNGPLGEYVVFSIPFGLGLFAAHSSAAIFIASIIAAVFSIPILINYATLTAAMPRSGGDYVFNSRIIHPAIGFAANFSLSVWQVVGSGAFAALIVTTILSPAATILGSIIGSTGLTNFGTTLTDRPWLIGVSALLLILVGLTLSTGTQRALRINTTIWAIGMVSMTLLILILLFTSHAGFITKFNHFMGSSSAYNQVISNATKDGFAERGTLLMIWPLTAVAMAVFGWYFWMTYFGAEVKQARSWGREVRMMFFPLLVNGAYVLAITAVMIHTFGYRFLSSVSYLALVDPSKLAGPVAAGAPVFFTGLSAGNKVLATVFILGFIAWGWPLLVCFLIMPIRCALAWSVDQVFPASLVNVSPRFHTPVLLTAIVVVAAVVVAVVAAYTKQIFQIFAVEIMATALFSQGITGVASLLFPYRMRELYGQQPVSRYRLFGLPLLTVTGILAIAFTLFWTSAYLRFPTEFGLTSGIGWTFIIVFVFSIVLFYVMRTVRERQGIPVRLAFTEIPPE